MNLNKELKYLVGVSGGPDSIYLLEQLKINGINNIIVCHVNYNYRTDSYLDETIVTQYCNKNNLTLEKLILKQDYKNLNKNFESWAREIRYDFFVEVSKKYNTQNLLLGHNLNDHIETYLMQRQRKNLVKFFGIRIISNYKNLVVIRPLINIKKSLIINWLNKNDITYATDSTNSDTKFLRNKIREKLNEEDFGKLSKIIDEENKKLQEKNNKVEMFVRNNTSEFELILNKQISSSSIEFIQRCTYSWLENGGRSFLLQNRANKTLIEIAKNIHSSTKSFWKISLGDYTIYKDYDKLKIVHNSVLLKKTHNINSQDDMQLLYCFPNWLELHNAIKKNQDKFPYIVTNDYDWYKTKTFVGNKKTNRFFIDKKISHSIRMVNGVVFNVNQCKILNSIKQ